MYGHLIMENMEIDQFVIRITGYEIGMEGELRQFWNVFLKQECKVVPVVVNWIYLFTLKSLSKGFVVKTKNALGTVYKPTP